MANIINKQTGDVQENAPYSEDDELLQCGLLNWRIATEDEVLDWKNTNADRIKNQKIAFYQSQIDDIDKKRIRAICEPSIKDEVTGQTWLEYYNLQVQDIRTQIATLG